jgi:glucosamine--fructose-6-phosphate aminotransferase (isomerizing)
MSKPLDPAHAPTPLSPRQLLDDTLKIPDTLGASFDALADSVRHALDGADVANIDRIVLGGSGDLHHSALATEVAFARLTGLPTRALTSMSLGLYHARDLGPRSLVIQMTFSGKTARAVEAATLARLAGARVWGLTSVAGSPLALMSERCLIKPDTGRNEAAGYPVTMLLLYLVAIQVAEMRSRISNDDAISLRTKLERSINDMRTTLRQCLPVAQGLVEQYQDMDHALFLASGPTFASAVNGSARILEAVGLNASAQDIEEWVHLDRWVEETRSPSFVIVPRGPARDRAREVLDAMSALGKPSVAITDDADRELGLAAKAWLPVHSSLPEALSPFLYHLPGELFAHLLAVQRHAHPYRGDMDAYLRLGEIRWGGVVQRSMPADDLR